MGELDELNYSLEGGWTGTVWTQVGKPGTGCVQDHLGPDSLDEGSSAAAVSQYHLLLSKASLILGGHAGLAFAVAVLVLSPLVGLWG